jgi:hypothetical protein
MEARSPSHVVVPDGGEPSAVRRCRHRVVPPPYSTGWRESSSPDYSRAVTVAAACDSPSRARNQPRPRDRVGRRTTSGVAPTAFARTPAVQHRGQCATAADDDHAYGSTRLAPRVSAPFVETSCDSPVLRASRSSTAGVRSRSSPDCRYVLWSARLPAEGAKSQPPVRGRVCTVPGDNPQRRAITPTRRAGPDLLLGGVPMDLSRGFRRRVRSRARGPVLPARVVRRS